MMTIKTVMVDSQLLESVEVVKCEGAEAISKVKKESRDLLDMWLEQAS
jgi:hypothetical protein